MSDLSGNSIEKKIIKILSAKGTKGSGSLHNDIDFVIGNNNVELKTTEKDYFVVDCEICKKIAETSALRNKVGKLLIIFNKDEKLENDIYLLYDVSCISTIHHPPADIKSYRISMVGPPHILFMCNYCMILTNQGKVKGLPQCLT